METKFNSGGDKMRNLTIKRAKSFVGCLAKIKIFIEDSAEGDVNIKNVMCRLLGTIKNGEEKTFQITENESKLFVIIDNLSKDYCNELYCLPAGTDDVVLTGKNRFNPALGNAFRFDGVTDEAALQNRRSGSRKGTAVFIVSLVVGFAIGFLLVSALLSGNRSDPKTFSSGGMTITLTKAFSEQSFDSVTAAFASKNVAVYAIKESFGGVEGFSAYSLPEYGKLLIKANNIDAPDGISEKNGIVYFEYEFYNSENKSTYSYFSVLFKTDDAFWTVQFVCLDEIYEEYSRQFFDWAETIAFDK